MMEQLVYTRSYPHIELNNGGRISKDDGFGVFSTSEGLLAEPSVTNNGFLFSRLAVMNASRENGPVGLLRSYDYFELSKDTYAFSFEVARPLCRVPRKNGYGHRPGNYIKQCLVGKLQDYPHLWFGSNVWTEWKKDENDFYMDLDPNPVPSPLPRVDDHPSGGSVTEETIRNFVQDGRAEAVKAGIWFLLTECAKPAEQRKIVIIRDTPEQVELWIAAMEYAFSPELACQITFSTNKTGLNNRVDAMLFGSTEARTQTMPTMSRGNKKPYFEIVGIHPNDNFCSMVRPEPNANYCMIDGRTKAASFTPEGDISAPYFRAAVQYGADIRDFSTVVLPSLPVHSFTGKLPELYDAYIYLLDTNHRAEKWSYRASLDALNALTQFGMPQNQTLLNYILDEFLRTYSRFSAEDRSHGFSLLKKLQALSRLVARENSIRNITLEMINSAILDLDSDGNALFETWAGLKTLNMHQSIYPLLQKIFSDENLNDKSKTVGNASPASAATMVELLLEAASQEPNGLSSLQGNGSKYGILCASFIRMTDQPALIPGAMKPLQKAPELRTNVFLSVAKYLKMTDQTKLPVWWNATADSCGGDIQSLCRSLCQSNNTKMDDIEELLRARILKVRSCPSACELAFCESCKNLGREEATGQIFYSAWIQVASLTETERIIRSIQSNELSEATEKYLFRLLDGYVSNEDPSRLSNATVSSMKRWSNQIGVPSINISLSELLKNLDRNKYPLQATRCIQSFGEQQIPLPEHFTGKAAFQKLAELGAQFASSEYHSAVMEMFVISDDRAQDSFAKAYVSAVLNESRGKQIVPSLLSLCEAGMGPNALIGGGSSSHSEGISERQGASYSNNLNSPSRRGFDHFGGYQSGRGFYGSNSNLPERHGKPITGDPVDNMLHGKKQDQAHIEEQTRKRSNAEKLLLALENVLPQFYKSTILSQVEKTINCAPAVKQRMIEMLQTASSHPSSTSSQNGFDKIFGLFRGKK